MEHLKRRFIGHKKTPTCNFGTQFARTGTAVEIRQSPEREGTRNVNVTLLPSVRLTLKLFPLLLLYTILLQACTIILVVWQFSLGIQSSKLGFHGLHTVEPGLLKAITKFRYIKHVSSKYEPTYVLFEVKAVSQHLRDEIK